MEKNSFFVAQKYGKPSSFFGKKTGADKGLTKEKGKKGCFFAGYFLSKIILNNPIAMKYLIIGMGPGIGWSLATTFGKAGFEILMVARSEERLREMEQRLAEQSIVAKGYSVDLAEPEAFAAFIQQLASEHPDTAVVHYNASAFHLGSPLELPLETFISAVHTCVTGGLAAVQAFYPILEKQSKAAFFFTGGGSALHPNAATFSLSIGKAGLRNLALSLVEACAGSSVQVGTVTVAGMVKSGTALDPDLIAAQFAVLWEQGKQKAAVEVLMEG